MACILGPLLLKKASHKGIVVDTVIVFAFSIARKNGSFFLLRTLKAIAASTLERAM